MLSDKPMRIRLAVSGIVLLSLFGILYLELWLQYWFPNVGFGSGFIITALVGAFAWSWTLPHPRQERKRREKLEQLRQQAETEKLQTTETLAEKRPWLPPQEKEDVV